MCLNRKFTVHTKIKKTNKKMNPNYVSEGCAICALRLDFETFDLFAGVGSTVDYLYIRTVLLGA